MIYKKNILASILSAPLVLVSISIASGPVFLLFISPSTILMEERLNATSFLTPYTISIFLLTVVFRKKFIRYFAISRYAAIPLIITLFILLISSIIYSPHVGLSAFNFSFLAAILFYVCASGAMQEDSTVLKSVIYSYIVTCTLISILYILLLNTPFVQTSLGRHFFFGENPNSYSTRMTISIILIIFSFRSLSKQRRYLLALSIIPQLFIIYLSGSRGTVLMLAGVIFMLLFSSTLSLPKKILYSGLIILISFVASIYRKDHHAPDEDLFDRMTSMIEKKESAGRDDLWKQAFEIFEDNPILGVGDIGFTAEMQNRFNESRDVHNLFLYFLTTTGIVGFTLFLFFLLPLFKSSMKKAKKDPMSLALLFAILLFASKSGGILSYSLMWFVFAIVNALNKNKKYA